MAASTIQVASNMPVIRTTFLPTTGSSDPFYGGCYYERYGNIVHVHVGVKSITTNTVLQIYTLPSEVRPSVPAGQTKVTIFGHGTGGSSSNIGYLDVSSDGVVQIRSNGGTAVGADVTYFI